MKMMTFGNGFESGGVAETIAGEDWDFWIRLQWFWLLIVVEAKLIHLGVDKQYKNAKTPAFSKTYWCRRDGTLQFTWLLWMSSLWMILILSS